MESQEKTQLARLIRGQRWAGLATLSKGAPYASMVAYAPEPDFSGFILHLSRLSAHTRHLLADPRASMVITEPDTGGGDPQTLARVSIQGKAREISRQEAEYEGLRSLYIERLPESEMLFGFGDFLLFRLIAEEARYVGGFGRAATFSASRLKEAAGG